MKTYLRYFATTDESPAGRVALEYLRGLLRVGPVRVLSTSGGLQGRWEGYAQLLSTPVSYPFVNLVSCLPERWIWTQRIALPPQATSPLSGTSASRDKPREISDGTHWLYTDGVRNVLLAAVPPNTPEQMDTSLRYEAIVVPTAALRDPWLQKGREPTLLPVPVVDHDSLRRIVLDE